jgi:molybdopterin synthase sulfur carrier subunit
MTTLRMFASAREAAGTGRAVFDGATVAEVLAQATDTFGAEFARVLPTCKVWVNGDEAEPSTPVTASDVVAVLPPVSGGA